MKVRTSWIVWGVIIVIIGIGYFSFHKWYQDNYGGDPYYVKITTNGTPKGSGQDLLYSYTQTAYSPSGTGKRMTFLSVKPKPLKKNAYLKLSYNEKRQVVVAFEKVDKSSIPGPAANQLP